MWSGKKQDGEVYTGALDNTDVGKEETENVREPGSTEVERGGGEEERTLRNSTLIKVEPTRDLGSWLLPCPPATSSCELKFIFIAFQ